jgi:hypothetical protein
LKIIVKGEKELKKRLLAGLAVGVMLFGMAGAASGTIIGVGDFLSPTIIDFETVPSGLIGSFYAGQGVTFAHLDGGQTYNTGTGGGSSLTATNFYSEAGFPNGEAIFSSLINKVGFYITTNNGDNTLVSAYSGSSLVGSEFFTTGGGGNDGSFAGLSFTSGFDRIVISTEYNINGAFAIDNFRFEGGTQPVPEPATMLLMGTGLAGLIGTRRKKKK